MGPLRHVPRRRILAQWLGQTARGAWDTTAYMVGAGIGEVLLRLGEKGLFGSHRGAHEARPQDRGASANGNPSEHMAPLATRLCEGGAMLRSTAQSARAVVRDLARPPLAFAERVELRPEPRTSLEGPEGCQPFQQLDQAFCGRIVRSGWQGEALLLAGDLEDGALLAWTEEGPKGRSLRVRGYLTEEGDRKMRAFMEAQPAASELRSSLEVPRRALDQGILQEGSETIRIPGGRRYQMETPQGLEMHYFPRVEGYKPEAALGTAPPASLQGQVELRLEGAEVRPEELELLLEPLRSAGVVRGMATPQDLEALYLQKMARALGADSEPFLAAFQAQPEAAGRIRVGREHLSRVMGVEDVARLPDYDWNPRFDSLFAGTPEPGATAGWPRWDRFDAGVYLGQELEGWRLTHHVHGQEGATVAAIIRGTGGLQATEERLGRLGMDSLGISSLKDRRTGGARYAFTHLEREPQTATLVFRQDLLRRVDQVGFRPGRFGNVYDGLDSLKTPLDAYHRTPMYEVMLKNSISFLDYLEQVNLPSQEDRAQVIQAFHDVGLRELHGVPVEEVVRVVDKTAS